METFNVADLLVHRHAIGNLADKTAVIGTRTRTYAELSDDVARLAAGLRRLGLHDYDRVLCVMEDDVDFLVTVVAAFHAHLVAVPISTMYQGHELAEIINDSGARVVVGSGTFREAIDAGVSASPAVEYLIVSGDYQPQVPDSVTVLSWSSLLDVTGDYPRQAVATNADAWALWLYTSGTTGTLKAAMHRHENIRQIYQTYGCGVLDITAEDRCLSIAKMFFAYGIGNSVFMPLAAGATTMLEPRLPSPEVIATRVDTDRPTLFFGVPTFYNKLVGSGVQKECFASVRYGVSAGEPLSADLQKKVLNRFGFEILDGLGSTESLHIFLSNFPGDVHPGTSGRPVPGYDVEIRDAQGNLCKPEVPGELYVRGESIALGYWQRAAAQRSVFVGEWLRTGDIYIQETNGIFRCLGRSSNMIKAGGIWVSPREVEDRVREHDGVVDAAVVGVADEDGLVKPVAAVVLDDGADGLTADDLIEWCRDGLAHFKAPRKVVFFKQLPMTATGKVQHFRIREQLADAGLFHQEKVTQESTDDRE